MALSTPTFSIITPSFNQGEFITQTIESVRTQDYEGIEHIVIDGGSTDQTVDILKSYPHLVWVSEPDRGQTHALNKGFRQARGDYLAWINADDWYAPNIFSELARALQQHPVVMGTCQFTDRDGAVTESVKNIERNWFDILKYWIYFASPAQPSIFFRRDALESVRLPNGDYLDEDLHYCMDYELWLRLALKHPFTKRIDRVVAYFRNYETNKSGQDMAASYREDSRVFRRYNNLVSNAEHRVSFVLPLTRFDEEVQATVRAAASQQLRDVELLCVDYSDDAAQGRQLRQQIGRADHEIPQIAIRYVRSESPSLGAAFNKGCSAACAPLLAYLEPGASPTPDFSLSASNLFESDIFGAALPLQGKPEEFSHFSTELEGRRLFGLQSVFSPRSLGMHIVFRKTALLELGPVNPSLAPFLIWRTIFIRLLYKGWHISIDNSLSCSFASGFPFEDEHAAAFSSYLAAKLIVEVATEYEQDSFAAVRAAHGFAMLFPPEVVAKSRTLLQRGPADWSEHGSHNERAWIDLTIKNYPEFSPAWYLHACRLKTEGDERGAKESFQRFQDLRGKETL